MAKWGELKCPECADIDAAFSNLHREYDRRGDRIEELSNCVAVLEAKLERVVAAGVRMRDYFTRHSNQDVYAVQDFNEAIAELKGQGDE